MTIKKFDAIVIGAGGGTKLVKPLAARGLDVAIIEKESLGGTCLNRGCIPSKMIIYPAEIASLYKELEKLNFLQPKSELEMDFSSLIKRVSQTVDNESTSIEPAYQENKHIHYFHEEAQFVSDKVIELSKTKQQLTAKHIFIAGGSRPQIPDIPGLKETPFWTSREALRNTKLPKTLTVIGGGYIGLELGFAYGAFGCEVTFLVRSRMLKNEDKDVIDAIEKSFSERFNVHFKTVPTEIKYENEKFHLSCEKEGKALQIQSDALLVATGTIPNSNYLNLESTSIETDSRGYILVDQHLQTSASGVFALGDIIGKYQFRHSVNFEGEYLEDCLYNSPQYYPIQYPPMPHAVFTHPQIAGVGQTEQELIKNETPYVSGINTYKASAMGMARRPHEGFVKVLIHKESRKLIGAHIIGDEASNMIHLFIMAMTMDATIDDLLYMIYVHPALPEIARNALRKAKTSLDNDT